MSTDVAGPLPGTDPVPVAAARARRRPLTPSLTIGLVLVGLVVLLALVSFAWTPYDPTEVDATSRLQGAGADHLLGTDRLGRDVLSQIMWGARTTLFVGVVAVGVAALVGTPLGVLAGMAPRAVDQLVMRACDLLLAFPALLLAIMLGAVFSASTLTAMIAIGVATAPAFARMARGGTLQVMRSEYALAARAAGRTRLAIARRHVLPNIAPLLIVQASVAFGVAVLAEAALSFLGFGTEPPTPSWGRMLQESQETLHSAPMLSVWPGVAIAIAVLGFNMLGDGLRDRFDPRLDDRR
ncbi:ABC transporter permease [Patulibacter sp. SYSU D01012]|uniref:ABC transporter permease n=1 Tax=Patulibacter sp. SYSU D01012 TaxID=2817381 RepID=UPI001B303C0E|nr:ABC transporter permease [Patulibacter sp. SYSU D01012]